MGMADDYYTQKDPVELDCVYCGGTGEVEKDTCNECEGWGTVGEDAICDSCDCYPCRCDEEYDMWMDERMIDGME